MSNKINVMTRGEASEMAVLVFTDLHKFGIEFIYRHNTKTKQMIFTAVKDADLVKVHFPTFQIKFNTGSARYAELVINYE